LSASGWDITPTAGVNFTNSHAARFLTSSVFSYLDELARSLLVSRHRPPDDPEAANQGARTMTARLDSFHRSLAVVGSVLFTVAFVLISTPVVPIA
jgi:hypothetical protein